MVGKEPCASSVLMYRWHIPVELSQISRLSAASRKLVGHFKHSAIAMIALKDKQIQLHVSQHHLIQDVSTRWNSIYFMFKRLLEQHCMGCIHDQQVLDTKYRSLNLTEEQWAILEQMVTALKPLQVAITALCEAEIVCVIQ